jgi:hypothetical protein
MLPEKGLVLVYIYTNTMYRLCVSSNYHVTDRKAL